jgi:quercetin dioxygenase-like cupin family protein
MTGITTKTLLERRIERLPPLPLCWDIRKGSLEPGASAPAKGFHTHGWVLAYVTGGAERVTYDNGAQFHINAGEGTLFEANRAHRHESIGKEPRTNIAFEMTCERMKTSVANSGELPRMRTDVPYQIQLRERIWAPGAKTPVHILSGPTTTLVLEGTIGQSQSKRTARSAAGEVYVSPVGELAQNSCVSPTPCRTLDIDTWPSGEKRTVPQPATVQLPAP